MTSFARTSIVAFPRGHEFEPWTLTIGTEQIAAYVRATGDANDYGDTVPSLAAVALALAALQDRVALPEGSLHTGQEVEHEGVLRAGEAMTVRGRIAQRSERQGFVVSVIELEISGADGAGIRARTTIIAPGEGA